MNDIAENLIEKENEVLGNELLKFKKEIYKNLVFKDESGERDIDVYRITDLKVFKKDNKVVIYIKSIRPGIVIGKYGRIINGLKNHLKEVFENTEIFIKLEEDNIWKNIWSV